MLDLSSLLSAGDDAEADVEPVAINDAKMEVSLSEFAIERAPVIGVLPALSEPSRPSFGAEESEMTEEAGTGECEGTDEAVGKVKPDGPDTD